MSPVHDAHPPPAHTALVSSNTFVGTSSGFYYDEEISWEQRAREEERDGLFYAMYEKQQDMMEFMQESQCQTDRSL